ncbi:MAG: hypothetical protein GFH27_549283n123 [Chloroflexi bacterium AL-W]|nr:hypothetical protein [Chloroflexi bacterium AL-N1]NOK64756.1 hypothetical protein [Chloroflexi bacterium AL-N10]NOK75997.1 hypothetical protein [Chloroflexi bacterium AL-N5]NOK80244.1 hypothetical protein [Chloroflexi bacterium AL-W]NOK86757.1 hypothetical protein [Chloroflexi bacterium AL-N15]
MADTTSEKKRPWWLRLGCIIPPIVAVAILVLGVWIYLNLYQGRDFSRVTGVPVEVKLPECITNVDQIVSIGFHSRGAGETIKDVTYVCDDRIFSREYNDFGLLQGSIEWTFQDQR